MASTDVLAERPDVHPGAHPINAKRAREVVADEVAGEEGASSDSTSTGPAARRTSRCHEHAPAEVLCNTREVTPWEFHPSQVRNASVAMKRLSGGSCHDACPIMKPCV